MKKFKIHFYRAPIKDNNEIGPTSEWQIYEASSKTVAIRFAKAHAKVYDWRFMSCTEILPQKESEAL